MGRREEKMNKCITRKRGSEGVIKISHYYMGEIVRLCLYTIKKTDETNLQNIRSKMGEIKNRTQERVVYGPNVTPPTQQGYAQQPTARK